MKLTATSLFLLALYPLTVHAQSAAPDDVKIVSAQPANTKKLPPYVVYRHFLACVNQLDKDAKRSGTRLLGR